MRIAQLLLSSRDTQSICTYCSCEIYTHSCTATQGLLHGLQLRFHQGIALFEGLVFFGKARLVLVSCHAPPCPQGLRRFRINLSCFVRPQAYECGTKSRHIKKSQLSRLLSRYAARPMTKQLSVSKRERIDDRSSHAFFFSFFIREAYLRFPAALLTHGNWNFAELECLYSCSPSFSGEMHTANVDHANAFAS